MKKKALILCLAICTLFALSSVCASDANDTAVASDDNDMELSQDSINEAIDDNLKSEETDEIVAEGTGTFTDLDTKINGNNDSDVYLECNYTFESGTDGSFKNGVSISRAVTVHGNGYTLDGAKGARIFSVSHANVTFKDLFFVNGKVGGNGGAISGKCTVVNCTFYSNYASVWGGALYGSSTAVNCTFISNKGLYYGGAMYYGSAVNCIFMYNSAPEYCGGALYDCSAVDCIFYSNSASKNGGATYRGSAENCIFESNSAGEAGGAMSGGTAKNCTFTSNLANVGGFGGATAGTTAVDCTFTSNVAVCGGAMSSGSATNCTFISNSGRTGGAMYSANAVNCSFTSNIGTSGGAMNGGTATNCSFTSNRASDSGGAIYGGSAVNCNFTNNRASDSGGAMYYLSSSGPTATDCRFVNNTAKNGGGTYQIIAYNCNFTHNTATEYGGAMYKGTLSNCVFEENTAGIEGNDTYQTAYPKATLKVSDFTSTYRSGDRLLFNMTTETGMQVNNANVTIRIYKDNELFTTRYASSGEGWIVEIDSGSYIAECSIENQQYQVSPVNATLSIGKADSTVSLTEVVYNAGGFGVSFATFTGATNITASVNGHSEAIVNVTGNVITISGLSFGDYTLKATTVPDGNHNSVSNTTTLTVNKGDSAVFLTPVVFDYGGCGTSTATLVSATNVTAIVVDHPEAAVSVSGNAITVSGLDAGPYTLKVTTVPEKYYSAVSNTTTITVNRANSSVDVNPLEFDYNGMGSTTASYTNATGITAEVTDQPKAVVNVENNRITVSNLDAGTYTLKVTTITDSNHNSASATANITVKAVETQLSADAVTTTYNADKDLIITLKDANGNPLSDISISVDLNGVKYYTTDQNGQVKINVAKLDSKNYTAKIEFAGNNNCKPSSANATVTVNQAETRLYADAVTATYNVNRDLIITLKDANGNPLSDISISVDLNGVKYYTTDKNGQVKINVAKLVPKTYTAKIAFAGDGNCKPSSASATVTVKKATPKLTAKAKTFKKSVKTKRYTVTLKDNTNRAIKNAKVTIKIKKKTYTAKTNAKGKATFKIKKLTRKGTYKSTVTYKGDSCYSKVTKKVKIKVK